MVEQRSDGLPLSSWINVVISFLFMAISALLLLGLLVALVWGPLTVGVVLLYTPYGWVGLAISALFGFANASRYYKRAKSELTT